MTGISCARVVLVDVNYPDYEAEREILAPFQANLEHVAAQGALDRTVDAVRDAHAVMVREAPIPRDAICAMSQCRIIVRYGVGVDNIDLEAARSRRIFVANVPKYGGDEVADHSIALLLAVARRIVQRDRAVRNGIWGVGPREPIYSLSNRTLGIIGYGRIGRTMHQKASCLGFGRTLVFDPYLREAPAGVERVDLDTLCSEADAISLHTPLTSENHHLIDTTRIALMKPTCILINTSRGGLVDEEALADALAEGRLFGAGIDVFEYEPPMRNHRLFLLDNVIVTDHTAWYSEESLRDLQTKAAQEVARVLSGGKPLSWVNCWED